MTFKYRDRIRIKEGAIGIVDLPDWVYEKYPGEYPPKGTPADVGGLIGTIGLITENECHVDPDYDKERPVSQNSWIVKIDDLEHVE